MNCYVCDETRSVRPAVAICWSCHVGLCRDHLREELRKFGPGGQNTVCSHTEQLEPNR